MRQSARTLSPADIRALNRQLVPRGRKLCACCGGNFPLDEAHWYWSANTRTGKRYANSDCKACACKEASRKKMDAYAHDAQVKADTIRRARDWRLSHPETYRELTAQSRLNRKRRKLKEVLYGSD